MLSLASAVHLLAVVIWVGGMFFAHMALRPAVAEVLQPPERLRLMGKTLANFFVWVWVAVILILATGYWLFFQVYGAAAAGYLHAMQALGLLMSGLFVFLFFKPYQLFKRSLSADDVPAAAAALAIIRKIIATNLILGLITVFIGAGKFF